MFTTESERSLERNAQKTFAQALSPSATASEALAHYVRMLASAGRPDLIAELEASDEAQQRVLGLSVWP